MIKCSFVIIFAILLFFLPARGQRQDGSVLERRITIDLQNQPLSTILDQLSWQAGIYFSYDASIIDSNKKYTIETDGKSLFSILNQLFNPKEFKFFEMENQVIITRRTDSNQMITAQNDTIPVKYFFLSGKIVDEKRGEPVSYATVSFLNKPIGTITNTDGDFLLKVHPNLIRDTVVISCLGYSQIIVPAFKLMDEDLFIMKPKSIRIREIKVTATTPEKLLENIRYNLKVNYSESTKLMTAFYRETVQQDGTGYASLCGGTGHW